MTDRGKSVLKVSLAIGILAAAVLIGAVRIRGSFTYGEEGARSFFYNQTRKQLYTVPRDSIPPDPALADGAGVRAVVVAWRSERDDPAKRRIAYLETYTPELAKVLREVQAARAAGRRPDQKAPSGDSPFVLQNTLVRRETESVWHDMTTPEARAIVSEWQTRAGPDGAPPVICMP